MRHLIVLVFALLFGHAAFAADCPVVGETGMPSIAGVDRTTLVCHPGYAALHDDALLVPRWIAYRLTAMHTMGCLKPVENFHGDEALPPGRRAEPEDYRRSGLDRGHQAPAEDFAWDSVLLRDSFSMVNVAPQLPGLNREGWERLEVTIRAWAWTRGDLVIYVGPVLNDQPPAIADGRVAIPVGFFKVVFDPRSGEAIGFLMPQRYISKGNLDRWVTSIAEIEARTGIKFPLPGTIDLMARPLLWPADISGWRHSHRQVCAAVRQLSRP
ncbi:DNA/RNA non-specific endonuclease [Telmatospirillum sp.]|uniref:DNA/RNA non-specific endonuclease n=1 Tax=Telmatospirillum sp. TaxID=2079197 RepID=UPI002842229A|nr:DNA/RNA non-specific endonuclease [Telmatospirillum sp.]MDR3438897.1 DNA/RNA non-specific endonuclease [Telmatospirillum sp.]